MLSKLMMEVFPSSLFRDYSLLVIILFCSFNLIAIKGDFYLGKLAR